MLAHAEVDASETSAAVRPVAPPVVSNGASQNAVEHALHRLEKPLRTAWEHAPSPFSPPHAASIGASVPASVVKPVGVNTLPRVDTMSATAPVENTERESLSVASSDPLGLERVASSGATSPDTASAGSARPQVMSATVANNAASPANASSSRESVNTASADSVNDSSRGPGAVTVLAQANGVSSDRAVAQTSSGPIVTPVTRAAATIPITTAAETRSTTAVIPPTVTTTRTVATATVVAPATRDTVAVSAPIDLRSSSVRTSTTMTEPVPVVATREAVPATPAPIMRSCQSNFLQCDHAQNWRMNLQPDEWWSVRFGSGRRVALLVVPQIDGQLVMLVDPMQNRVAACRVAEVAPASGVPMQNGDAKILEDFPASQMNEDAIKALLEADSKPLTSPLIVRPGTMCGLEIRDLLVQGRRRTIAPRSTADSDVIYRESSFGIDRAGDIVQFTPLRTTDAASSVIGRLPIVPRFFLPYSVMDGTMHQRLILVADAGRMHWFDPQRQMIIDGAMAAPFENFADTVGLMALSTTDNENAGLFSLHIDRADRSFIMNWIPGRAVLATTVVMTPTTPVDPSAMTRETTSVVSSPLRLPVPTTTTSVITR